jgi:hypothetical protein
VVLITDDGPFVYGTCVFCSAGLPWARKARTICDRRECKSAASAASGRQAAARARRRQIEAAERTCTGPCGRTLPQDRDHYSIRKRDDDGTIRWDAQCKRCRNEQHRRRYAERADYRAKKLADARRQRDRERALMEADPDFAAEQRQRKREWQAAYRAAHPDRIRKWQARYRRSVKRSPTKLRRKREGQRIGYRLRAERAGRTVRVRTVERDRDEQRQHYGRLPVAPLAEAVERHIARELAVFGATGAANITRESIAESLGTTARTLSAWKPDDDGTAERVLVKFDTADAILQALGLHPFDVWQDPDVLALWGC